MTSFTVDFEQEGRRRCGDCRLCCKLLPVPPIGKKSNVWCQHCRAGKGCTIYASRPDACRMFSCLWILEPELVAQRPDHSRVVFDMMPGQIGLEDKLTGEIATHLVQQLWVDPAFPDAHRAPAVREIIRRIGLEKKIVTLARIQTATLARAIVICPPNLAEDGQWHEKESECSQDFPSTPFG